MKTAWEITQETKTLPKLNNPIFIEGLPGMGNVGKITVDFFIEELKAQKLYSFFSHKFPLSVFVNEQNLIEMPKLEVYYKKFNSNGQKHDLLLLTGDIQPIDEESCYAFCEQILTIVQQFQCREVITTGGIGLQSIPEKSRVFCTANNPQILKEYQKKNMLVEKEIFGVVGPIVGVSGILLGLAKRKNIKAVSLLAETFGHPMYLGIKGAKEIIRVLETKFNYGLDLKKMSREIMEVEREIIKKTKEWTEEMAAGSAGAKMKKRDVGYIG